MRWQIDLSFPCFLLEIVCWIWICVCLDFRQLSREPIRWKPTPLCKTQSEAYRFRTSEKYFFVAI
jgi:hypothetical protein